MKKKVRPKPKSLDGNLTVTEKGEAIYPTHTCFDDYHQLIADALDQNIKMFICHGILLMKDDGKPYAHCWLEYGDQAVESGIYKGKMIYLHYEKRKFVKKHRPIKVTRYTIRGALVESEKHGGLTGPWKQEYIELLRDYKKPEEGS